MLSSGKLALMLCSYLPPRARHASLAIAVTMLGCDKAPPSDPAMTSASPAPAPPSGAELLAHLTANDPEMKASAVAIAASGDETTRRAAGPKIVMLARRIDSTEWRDTKRATLKEANALAKVEPTPDQFERQLTSWQLEELQHVLEAMGAIGGAEVVAYCLELGEREEAPIGSRRAALLVLERIIDPGDAAALARRSAIASRLIAIEAASAQAPGISSSAPDGGRRRSGLVGNAQVGGGIVSGGNVGNASSVIAGMAAGFRRCYNRGLVDSPDMTGSVRITAKIGPSGEVLSASPSGGGGLSGEVVSCVAARVTSAQFAPPEGGGATIVIPVTFVTQ